MTRRGKVFHSKHGRPGKRQREGTRPPRQHQEARFEGEILGRIYTAEMPLSAQDLLEALELSKSHRQEVLGVLEDLCRRKVLSCRRDTFALRKSVELFAGPISVTTKGYGFVAPTEAPAELEIDQDVFIPPGMLGGAAHSDKVLVHIEDYEIVIDEDSKLAIPKSELQAKVDSGETKRIRTVPAVAGGNYSEKDDETLKKTMRLKIGEELVVECDGMKGSIPSVKVFV
ncbi:MAG: hypothetical protein KKD53_09745, partial [Proteobacteria bacterium]|nr:hypothetical protein [Pseudomonadota bacterium]